MTLSKAVPKEYYSEIEAARSLGITLARLHQLLDQHIFNDGSRRPAHLSFNSGDLLLLSYWNKEDARRGRRRNNIVSISGSIQG